MKIIKIFFWNCGLAHLDNARPSYTDIQKVMSIIQILMEEKDGDIIVLCEVNSYVCEIFKHNFSNYIISGLNTRSTPNSHFDMISISKTSVEIKNVLYIRQSNLSEEQEKIEKSERFLPNSGRTMKVGVDITFSVKNISNYFNLIVSHWSSRMNGFSDENREESGEALKFYVRKLVEKKSQVILMGDYNDPPNSISIEHKLGAINNRYYASIDARRIYNPSYSFFVPHKPYYNGEKQHFHGTWLSKKDTIRKNQKISCQVLDQVMVTSSFINSGPWYLDEKNTRVISDEKIMNLLYDGTIDHLPITINLSHLIQIEE